MPNKKKPARAPKTSGSMSEELLETLRSQQAVMEDIRSQNRLTAESVHAEVHALAQKVDEGMRASEERDRLLEAAIRDVRAGLKADIVRVEGKVDKLDARVEGLEFKVDKLDARLGRLEVKVESLDTKVEKLVPLEDRVVLLERRGA